MTVPNRSIDWAIQSVPEIVQKTLVDFTREDLYIGLPATVVNVDNYEKQQVVDVKPVVNDVYEDDMLVRAVTLKSIFVKIPHGNGFAFKLPIAVGDLVTLHYCHRDISTFLDGQGDDVDASLNLVADIRDCYITHGFGTRNVNQSPSKDNLEIVGDNTTITITPDGTLTTTTKKVVVKADEYEIDSPLTTFKQDVIFEKSINVTTEATIGGKPFTTHTHISNGSGNPTDPPT